MELFDLLDEFKKANIGLSMEQEREIIAEYVYSTNRLEGNALTLAQTRSIIDNGIVSGENISTKDMLEQRGTYKALLRMMKAAAAGEPLTTDLVKELNWLAIDPLFHDDFYLTYKQAGQQPGQYKVRNNRIDITLPDGTRHTVSPLSNPESVATNMSMLLRQVDMSDKTVIEKAAFLAQGSGCTSPLLMETREPRACSSTS